MDFFRHPIGVALLFPHVEPAAMNHPDPVLARLFCGFEQGREPAIQPGEIIGRADPEDPGKDMGPAQEQMRQFFGVEVHATGWSGSRWAMRGVASSLFNEAGTTGAPA